MAYEIKKGDTLYQISKEYNVNTKLLAELNGLNLDDYIYPGQTILIPKKNVSYYPVDWQDLDNQPCIAIR